MTIAKQLVPACPRKGERDTQRVSNLFEKFEILSAGHLSSSHTDQRSQELTGNGQGWQGKEDPTDRHEMERQQHAACV